MKYYFLLITFTFFLTTISAQELTVYPGMFGFKYYQDDVMISKKEFVYQLEKDANSRELWRKARNNNTLGYVCLGVQLGFLYLALDQGQQSISGRKINKQSLIYGGTSIATGIVGIVFNFKKLSLQRRAILAFNNSFDRPTSYIAPIFKNNGAGLVMTF